MNRKVYTGMILTLMTMLSMASIYRLQETKNRERANRQGTSVFKNVTICNSPDFNKSNNMKAVKVQYTVRPEFAERNASNIQEVMAELRKLNSNNIRYSSFTKSDKVSFVHFVITAEGGNEVLTGLPSFKKFQTELKASSPVAGPDVEPLSLVGSSYDFFY